MKKFNPRGRSLVILILLILVFPISGCTSPDRITSGATPADTPTSEDRDPIRSETAGKEPQSTGAPTEIKPTLDVKGTLSADETALVMDALLNGGGSAVDEALGRLTASGDERFVPVLIELVRAVQIGIRPFNLYRPYIYALQELSGQPIGDDWPAWVEWYGGADITPPPGFTSWKGELMGKIDPRFAEFLQDEFESAIQVEEIVWGGVVVDGIPALDHSPMVAADEAGYLDPQDVVFGISINGDSRAYPLRILDWHEMANDTVGEVPVSLAYCTLCGAGIAFDGRAPGGKTYDFGSSGFLYRSNKLMYDRQTNSLWNQLTGEPVLGPLVGEGIQLELLPVVVATWEDWRSRHPDTLVLDLDTKFNRYYEPGAAYGDYFASGDTMFPVWERSDLLPDKSFVYALRLEGVPKAYPVDLLVDEMVVNDSVGDTDLVLVASHGVLQVEGEDLRTGPASYTSGAEVRAFLRDGYTFQPGDGPDRLVDQNGGVWEVAEEGLVGPGGERLERVNGHLAYWFGWFAFFPKTLVYGK